MNQEQVTKNCPFNGKWCEKSVCALYVEFGQTVAGMQRKVGMCAFVGTNIILSEMNMKLQQQGKLSMPQIVIPGNGGRN